ncbi:MAG: heavy metal transporter [Bacillota bacterium]|nr:MAG: heavy metal transporter [Bacillota bacterium]
MKKIVKIENLDCANCAAKLERALNKIDGVSVNINFMAMKMALECADENYAAAAEEVRAVAARVLPECSFKGL